MRDGDVTRLDTVKGNQANTVATINGIAATPRFSPDGKRIALLVTIGAKKEAGATQAGVRQIGEMGEPYAERRLAIFDELGRAACRERVCQYVEISVVAVSVKKKKQKS